MSSTEMVRKTGLRFNNSVPYSWGDRIVLFTNRGIKLLHAKSEDFALAESV